MGKVRSNLIALILFVVAVFWCMAGYTVYADSAEGKSVSTSLVSLENTAAQKVKVTWSVVSGVTGYQIQYSTSKDFSSGTAAKYITSASKSSYVISGLTPGKKYYVRIRTYTKVDGKKYFSDWSSKKSVNVKVPVSEVTGTSLVATGKLKITWNRSKGATGYIVYRRQEGSSKWKKIATVTGEKQLYCYDSSVSAKTTYYYTVKAYVEVDGEVIYASCKKPGMEAYYSSVTVSAATGSDTSVYGSKLTAAQLSQVKSAVSSFCSTYITSDMSDLEKLIVAQLYMCKTCVYAADWSKNGANTAWGSLVYTNSSGQHEAQCSGYSRGFKALCDGMGVECQYVHSSSSSHQWVQVKIDGNWYIIDPTCNTSTNFWMFLICGSTFKRLWAGSYDMTWDTGSLGTLASADYSEAKIKSAFEGYKVQLAAKKMFGSSYEGIWWYRM